MVVKRKTSTYKYVLSGIITLLVFSLGISLGLLIDNERLEWLQEREEQRDLDYESLQFQYLYLSTLKKTNESCKILKTTFEDSVKELDITLEKLLAYKKGSDLNEDEYERLQRRYILDNIEYWLFAKEAKQECENVDLVTVLYFYSEDDCPSCSKQGVSLTHYKKIFNEQLLIFPINTDLETLEPMIKILKSQFDIEDTSIPHIVIENQKHDGVVELNQLGELICDSFKEQNQECSEIYSATNST